MALKVELKPGERILIGDSVVTNGAQRTRFLIEGRSPVWRERDILAAKQADTPAKRIYLAIVLMYTSRDPRAQHETYFALVREFLAAAPSAERYVELINNQILTGELYKALKTAKELVAYEQDLIDNEKCRPSLRKRRKSNLQSA
jgi:flagellar biosynthesis repressor protein FlbT